MELKQENETIILKTAMQYGIDEDIGIEVKISEKFGYARIEMTMPDGTKSVSAELQLKYTDNDELFAEVLTPDNRGEIEVAKLLPFK